MFESMFELGLIVFVFTCMALFIFCILLSVFVLFHSNKEAKKYEDLD